MRAVRRLSALVLIMVLAFPPRARAEPTHEFIMSATYGVLAGTLVGAATLAFTDKPGDNLRNIARGASYGLYAGILLGLYVVYGIPGEGSTPDLDEGPGAPAPEDRGDNPEEPLGPQGSLQFKRPDIYPLISERGVEGAALGVRLTF